MEISIFGDELPDEFICVFDETFFPGGIGVGEIDICMQHFGDVFVVGELGSVVCCDGADVPFKGFEELYDKLCYGLCVLASGRLGHEEFLGGALDQGDDGALAVLAYDGVHLPVAEAGLGVDRGRPFIDAYAVSDGDASTHRPPSVLEVVRQIGVQRAAAFLVQPDKVVYPLGRHAVPAVAAHDTDNSLRGPMPLEERDDLLPQVLCHTQCSPGYVSPHVGELLRIYPDVMTIHVQVSFYLPADR